MWRFWRGWFSILEVQFGLRGIELNTIQDSEPTKGSSLLLVLVLSLLCAGRGLEFLCSTRLTELQTVEAVIGLRFQLLSRLL